MRDPLLMLHEPPVPDQRRPEELKRKWYGKSAVRKSSRATSCGLFDDVHEVRNQAREGRDSLVAELVETRKKLDQANLKIWIMSLIVSPTIAAIFKAIWAKLTLRKPRSKSAVIADAQRFLAPGIEAHQARNQASRDARHHSIVRRERGLKRPYDTGRAGPPRRCLGDSGLPAGKKLQPAAAVLEAQFCAWQAWQAPRRLSTSKKARLSPPCCAM
jgi:hypothetical protein